MIDYESEEENIKKPIIGLFGTCGNSTWREDFIEIYDSEGLEYFNPQKTDWNPNDAANEAFHLANDEIILFPITSETYGLGSLAEVGFSILNAISLDNSRFFVVLIDDDVTEELKKENPILAEESKRNRALVRNHLKELRISNLYMVNNMEQLFEASIVLYQAAIAKNFMSKFNLHVNQNI
jgi:hypothetical protein